MHVVGSSSEVLIRAMMASYRWGWWLTNCDWMMVFQNELILLNVLEAAFDAVSSLLKYAVCR